MKKTILCLMLALCLCLCVIFASCDEEQVPPETPPTEQNPPDQTPTTDDGGKKGNIYHTTDTSAGNVDVEDGGVERPQVNDTSTLPY